MIGRVIGSYEVQARIGTGGMGSVWRGLDVMLDRPVAIKALRADIASNPQAVERFRQEARILARFLHPHIATLYALLRDGDDFFMVMEYVEGETFEELLRRERALVPAHAVPLVRQALDGIEQAHHHGVIHRDIKPANLILTPGGTVKVMDFGIARLRGSQRMTRTHFTIGTAAYMAPEQIRSLDLDARADVYAIGVLLYELLTGRVPFKSESSFEVMQAHLQTPPPPPSEFVPDLPDDLEQIILRTLAKKPDDRFPSAAALHEALDALDLPDPPYDLTAPTLVEAPVPTEKVTNADTPTPPPEAAAPTPPSETAAPTPPPEQTRIADPAPIPLPTSEPAPVDPEATAVTSTPYVPQDLDKTVLLSEYTPKAAEPLAATTIASTPRAARNSPTAWDRVQDYRRLLAGLAALLLVFALLALILSQLDDTPSIAERAPTEQPTTLEAPPPSDLPPPAIQPETKDEVESPTEETATPPPPDPRPSSQQPTETQTPVERPPPARDREAERRPPPGDRPPPPPGTVRVLVRPYGDVYVDGRRLASGTNAPVTATLPPGPHRVRAVHPTLGSLERQITIEPDQTREVLLEFDARAQAPVEITVLSDPVNAEILVDGERTGRYTPATVRLTPGNHTVGLRLRGHTAAERTVTVTAGRPDRVFFTLTRQ